MKYDSGPQIAAIKRELAGIAVNKWAEYDKLIQCANNYTKDDEALQMVKEALATEARAQDFLLKEEEELSMIMGNWELAFGYIN